MFFESTMFSTLFKTLNGACLQCMDLFFFLLAMSLVMTAVSRAETTNDGSVPLTSHPGHLQPFGQSGKVTDVETITGFPEADDFLSNYFLKSKPLLMKGAAKSSPAFEKWSDSYLDQLSRVPENYQELLVETKKKEERNAESLHLTLHEFLKIYNYSDLYVVEDVPLFMRADVMMPCPLQGNVTLNQKMDAIMWFSSGGTSSVVHKDSLDNINCLFRGHKTLIMVNPQEYDTRTLIDRPENLFSDIDVDRVDLEKYPSLAGMRFYRADMEPGDCFYIPYRWVHQVRSTGSNLAVNLWWNHYETLRQMPKSKKSTASKNVLPCNSSLTVADALGESARVEDIAPYFEELQAIMLDVVGLRSEKKATIQDIVTTLNKDKNPELAVQHADALNQFAEILDKDKDGFLNDEEIKGSPGKLWTERRVASLLDEDVLSTVVATLFGDDGNDSPEENDDEEGLDLGITDILREYIVPSEEDNERDEESKYIKTEL